VYTREDLVLPDGNRVADGALLLLIVVETVVRHAVRAHMHGQVAQPKVANIRVAQLVLMVHLHARPV
jgi:hypothetical protein